jgi:hypothetical protein
MGGGRTGAVPDGFIGQKFNPRIVVPGKWRTWRSPSRQTCFSFGNQPLTPARGICLTYTFHLGIEDGSDSRDSASRRRQVARWGIDTHILP